MDPGALGKELQANNPLETEISRKRAPANELAMLVGQPMEMKNSKKQALAKELTTLADELLNKESWKNSKGPTVPVGVLGTRVPRLAGLRPTAWLHQRPGTAHLQHHQDKTLERGQASRGGRRQDLLR